MKEFIIKRTRIQLLCEGIIRIEQAHKKGFVDKPTYFIPERNFVGAEGDLKQTESGYEISFGEYTLTVPENGSVNGIKLLNGGKQCYKFKHETNTGELPLPEKTPGVYAVYDNPRIILPKEGYTAGAHYEVQSGVKDVYLLLCGGDHKKLRSLYVTLTGRGEMVRLSTLGFWNSRYFAYDDRGARAMIEDYKKHRIPLDNMVIDTDWRKASDRGIGYEIDDKLFPDMRAFINFAHGNGVEIMFNDHPEPVDGAASVLDKREIEYREYNLKSRLADGLDYWWYDRNWHTRLVSPAEGINPESLGMYLFSEVTENYFRSVDGRMHRRPVIMGNVDNIHNGNYLGINDSASHRYSVQWTGDIASDDSSLGAEIKNMLLAENSCITYVNSDCGGHTGNPDKKEYIRWMQFGAFSPVFRPHCTKIVERYREPWAYDEDTLDIARGYINMRYRLLPEIYKCAYESYECGKPLFTPLWYAYPSDKRAGRVFDEYLLGDGILVAPMHGTPEQKVAHSCYLKPVTAVYYNGTEHEGEPICSAEYKKLDMYLNHVGPEKGVPAYNFSAVFKTALEFEKDTELIVESDDGVTVYVDGKKTLEDNTFHGATKFKAGLLEGGKPHDIEIYYFQGGGEACISLYGKTYPDKYTLDSRIVYLPAGDWIDAFTGKEYSGPRSMNVTCPLKRMPLYIRRGAVIPLIKEAPSTKALNFGNIVYDFYPSAKDMYEGYLYEDDYKTVAYKEGEYRKSVFKTSYNPARNIVTLTLGAAKGKYYGIPQMRNILVKYHLLFGTARVGRVCVDGMETDYGIEEKSFSDYPFSAAENAINGPVVTVKTRQPTNKETRIDFYLI